MLSKVVCEVTYLVLCEQKDNRREQQLRILMPGKKDADHVVSKLLLAQCSSLTRRDHSAAEILRAKEGIVRVTCVCAQDGMAERVCEASD